MENLEFNETLEKYLKELNITLDNSKKEMLYKYMKILIEWNNKINLTSIIEEKEIIIKHFVDSLTILKYIKTEDKLIDIGTGAGFPGIPLKIAKNNIYLTLLDSLNKRILFLEEIKKQLKLENTECVHSRAEQYIIEKEKREWYDVGVSRAVASLNVLTEYILPYIKIGGLCICMKGPNIEEELENSKKAINILGGKIEKIEKINLPNTDIQRNIIIIKKIKSCPKQYPRKVGKAKNEPIK